MIDDTDKHRLLQFRESVIIPLSKTDADKWPIRSGRISSLCLDEFSHEFFEDIRLLRQQRMSMQAIAALFGHPSHLWRMSHHLLNGLRLLHTPLEDQQQAILTLLEIISFLKYGDIFCGDGTNIVWSPAQVEDTIRDIQTFEGFEMAHLVHKLAGVLWAYAESLYFVAHELSVEIHGPYKTSQHACLLVRDFFDLRPSALWPFENTFVPYQRVRILCIYHRFNAWLDVYNNLYVEAGTRLVDDVLSCRVLIDNRIATSSEIQQLIQAASAAIAKITRTVNVWSLEQIVQHYIYIFWWRKAALSKALHKDWQPPKEILDRVTERGIPDSSSANPPLETLRKQYTLL